MIVDFYSLEDHKKRSERMKQEAELLEKHKAYLRASAGGLIKGQESNLIGTKSPRNLMQSGSDPHIDAGLVIGTARTGTDHYHLVQTEALASPNHNSTKKHLPTYDLERILKLAEDAELKSKRRGGFGRKGERTTSRSANDIRLEQHVNGGYGQSDTHLIATGAGSNRKSSAGQFKFDEDGNRPGRYGVDPLERDRYHLNNQRASHSSREDSPGLSPLNKLEMMRQEMKRKKSGQTDSGSPSPAKEEQEKRSGFLSKMKDFDYSSLVNSKEPAGNDYGFQQRQPSKDLKKERDSKGRAGQGQNYNQDLNQGLFDLTETDGERQPKRSTSPKGFDRAGFGQGPIDLAKMTWAREPFSGGSRQDGSKQESKAAILIKQERERSQRGNTSNTRQTPSLFDSTYKKLTPLVPDSSKKDFFAKVEEDRAKKSQKSTGGKTSKDRSVSGSEGRRIARQRFHPPLDNKNPGYRSAFDSKNTKQFVQDAGIPDYRSAVSSSNYGRISKSGSRERSGSNLGLTKVLASLEDPRLSNPF